jgi:3-hydroxyisobutyrate dehydrogenase-like beta-hydroxyacid dehydrogenase
MTRVGWIGLGAMGAPMAACLARADTTPRPSTSTPRAPTRSRRTASSPPPNAPATKRYRPVGGCCHGTVCSP